MLPRSSLSQALWNNRVNGSGTMVRSLLALALLLGVLISLALPAPAPRSGSVAYLKAGAPAR